MERVPYKVLIELLSTKIENRIIKSRAENENLVDCPVKLLLLGGHALEAIAEAYKLPNIRIERLTDDIDVYTPDAQILGDYVSPTGATIPLTDDMKAEMFSWISGMDHKDNNLEQRIDTGLSNKTFRNIHKTKYCEFYVPTPEIFVVNKLMSYRQNNDREKDLKDIGMLLYGLKVSGRSKELITIQRDIRKFGLETEYAKAEAEMARYGAVTQQQTLNLKD